MVICSTKCYPCHNLMFFQYFCFIRKTMIETIKVGVTYFTQSKLRNNTQIA